LKLVGINPIKGKPEKNLKQNSHKKNIKVWNKKNKSKKSKTNQIIIKKIKIKFNIKIK
jgi:hypothetical protein